LEHRNRKPSVTLPPVAGEKLEESFALLIGATWWSELRAR
jgi:hypothetical protein